MKGALKLGLLTLIASLIKVGTVLAVSEWKFGDTVQLIVTTTNMGEDDVIRSTGTIIVRGGATKIQHTINNRYDTELLQKPLRVTFSPFISLYI